MAESIFFKAVESKVELMDILSLQDKNHLENLLLDQKKTNGFVTVRHTLDLLEKMNEQTPQIVAVDEQNHVVGYALSMLNSFSNMIPALVPMFEMFENIQFQGKKLSEYNYYVMGQICVA